MDLVHNLKGKIVVYCLELEPDEEGRPYRYVGTTSNCERRCAEHMGVKDGGAAWCKLHKPIDVLSVRVCQNKEEAAVMETMLCGLHQATIGYQQCRGARWNMGGDMQKKPPYFDKALEYKIHEEPVLELPKTLPPDYFTVAEENGIEETVHPTPAPCFSDWDARRPWKGIAVR